MQLFDYKEIYGELLEKLSIIKSQFRGLDAKLVELEMLQGDPQFWIDQSKAFEINKQLKNIEKKISSLKIATTKLADFEAIIELSEEDSQLFDEKEFDKIWKIAQNAIDELWTITLLSGEYDDADAILTLHSGAGGEEAQDWTEMLSRMYTRYSEREGMKVEIVDVSPGDGAGIKSKTFIVRGDNAYGYLKTERGVHRLVRLSPFDSNNRRHTSFASLEVSPLIENDSTIVIKDSDLKLDTYKSGGAGGQHVNKTESAVRITHIPTGIVVQCQNERSQIQNREMAIKVLKSKIKERELEEKERERQKKFGEEKKIEWGSQIRSYVLHPYNMVKDHRTGFETSDTGSVLDGNLQPFINEYLKKF